MEFPFRRLSWVLLPLVLLGLAGCLWAWLTWRPVTPDSFYGGTGSAVAATPGKLLAQETYVLGVPAGARAWRILYWTTQADGQARLASAVVMVAQEAPAGPRPVIAWTHGTTGVEPGCAPPVMGEPFTNVPALEGLLAAGWVYVGTDYAGQGTAGPHPYLIGEGEARSALDAVRAARQMSGLQLSSQTVIWGHSQGGHAALWTGMLAPRYAPDVPLAGVAAIAPASDLQPLLRAVHQMPVGRIMSAYLLRAYAQAYPDVDFDAYTSTKFAGALARDMAGRCLAGPQALVALANALLLGQGLFDGDPVHGPLAQRLAENTPEQLISVPLLIAQGESDPLVLPAIQQAFVARRCAAGQAIDFRRYEGKDHLSVLAPGAPLEADLLQWTHDRLAGAPAPKGCSGTS